VRIKRVIAGTSGSPGSLAALRYAECLARTYGATLVPLLAWEPPGGDGDSMLQLAGFASGGPCECCSRWRQGRT